MTGFGEQTQRMQAALSPVLTIGPEFLAGRVDAEDMARAMVQAVQAYADGERVHQRVKGQPDEASVPASAQRAAQELQAVLAEIYACGSGYLADRCDSDCVARTMAQIVGEFGELAPTS